MTSDAHYMDQAIVLARQGLGKTAPNPCVGAVLVKNNCVVAQGWHTAHGQPHAEIEALRQATARGVAPADCTLYVTLEPCNHQGQTPPCTRAILEAGIKTVVMGCQDPNPRVAGGGQAFLQSHGVTVRANVLNQACLDLIADFRIWQNTNRPFVIVKLATTLDGKIATRTGHSAWISSELSRTEVHKLRSWCGAVMVGGHTCRADNPSLTCRLDGYNGPQPLAIVVTRSLPASTRGSRLLTSRPADTIFWTTEAQSHSVHALRLTDQGALVWGLPAQDDGLDLMAGMRRLRQEKNCYYLLVEGGGHLAASLYTQGLLDELRLFQAMKILGDEKGQACFSGRTALTMDQAWDLRLLEHHLSGPDLYLRLRPKE